MEQDTQTSNIFDFLSVNFAKNASVNDILTEIQASQNDFLENKSDTLATPEYLQASPRIKTPLSANREKNIQHLIEQLVTNYPQFVVQVFSIDFQADKATKQIRTIEKIEFTVQLSHEKINFIKEKREQESINNFLNFIGQFGVVNFTKILNVAKNKHFLQQILNMVNDKTIFTFNQFEYDKSNVEKSEDYCFHIKHFNIVVEKLQTKAIHNIIAKHKQSVDVQMKKFGLLNAAFSDYKDSKLEYVLSVLLNDVFTLLDANDKQTVKNYNSLRAALLKTERILDPLIMLGTEITSCVNKLEMCGQDDLLSIIPNLTKELLNEWSHRHAANQKIVVTANTNGVIQYISASAFFKKYSDIINLITKEGHKLSQMSSTEKKRYLESADFFTDTVGELIDSGKISQIFTVANQTELKTLHSTFEAYKQQAEAERAVLMAKMESEKPKNIFMRIIEFIMKFFNARKNRHIKNKSASDVGVHDISGRKISLANPPAQHTMRLIDLIAQKSAPIIPLSDVIDLIPENDDDIRVLIETLEALRKKIVIPIYNSHKNLYPKRSYEILMADVEYLLVDTAHAISLEAIRNFIYSIRGYRLKNEAMPVTAIFAIEKHLTNLLRRKRMPKKPFHK